MLISTPRLLLQLSQDVLGYVFYILYQDLFDDYKDLDIMFGDVTVISPCKP